MGTAFLVYDNHDAESRSRVDLIRDSQIRSLPSEYNFLKRAYDKKAKLLSRLRDQFDNKTYDADGDYWWNITLLIIISIGAAAGLIVFLFP